MKTIMEYLDLDFSFSESNAVVHIKQGDAGGGKEIAIKLYDAGERVEVGSKTVVTLFASTNGVVTANGDSCPVNSNVVYVPITAALSAIAGREHCEIRVKTNDKIVHTARFDLLVGESAVNDDMPEYVSTASIISRIEALENGGSSGSGVEMWEIAEMIQSAFQARTPSQPPDSRTVTVGSADTLQENLPYIEINFAAVMPSDDGVMVWINDEELISPTRYRLSYNRSTRMLRVEFNADVISSLTNSDYIRVTVYNAVVSNDFLKVRAAIEAAYRNWEWHTVIVQSVTSDSSLIDEETLRPKMVLDNTVFPQSDTVLFIYKNERRIISPDDYVLSYDSTTKQATLTFWGDVFDVGDYVEFVTYTERQGISAGRAVIVSSGSMTAYQGTSEEG